METEQQQSIYQDKQVIDPETPTEKHLERVEERRIKQIKALVENLDSNYSKALNLELTKNQFFDIMRQVTQEKFIAIKEVQRMFQNRMRLVVAAKDYEVRCERTIAVETARTMLQETARNARESFNSEAQSLRTQYVKLLNLADLYEGTIKKQAGQIALQEQIIQKLSATLFKKQADELGDKIEIEELDLHEVNRHESNLIAPYLIDPFDFYGGNLKLSEVEKVRVTKDHLYKAQDLTIERLKEQVEFLENENEMLTNQMENFQSKYDEMDQTLKKNNNDIEVEREEMKDKLAFTCH